MTVLAALAHEAGHVRWAELNVPKGAGTDFDFTQLHSCQANGVATKDFFINWTTDYAMVAPNKWRPFGSTANQAVSPPDHRFQPTLQQLQNVSSSVNPSPSVLLNYYIYILYQANEPWPSIFGAQSPEEDFVETYTLRHLMAAGLTNLPLTIPGYTGTAFPTQWADVPRDVLSGAKPEMSRKVDCVKNYDSP